MNPKTKSCAGCLKRITNGNHLSCYLCSDTYDLDCANINFQLFTTMSKDRKDKWTCPKCHNKKKKSDNTNTPIIPKLGQKRNRRDFSSSPDETESNTVDQVTQRKKLQTSVSTDSSPSHIDESLLSTIRLEIQSSIDRSLKTVIESALKKEFEAIKIELNTLKDLKTGIEFLSDEYDRMKTELKTSEEKVKLLTNSNNSLLIKVGELSQRLNLIEQHARETNIEINGIPEGKTENLNNIAKQLCSVISIPSQVVEAASCTRVRKMNDTTSRPRAIIVKLLSVSKFNKKNPNEKLNTTHLGFTGTKTPVYVSEHLSPHYKALHARTRQVAREKSYEFVWIRSGRIFVRKNEHSPAKQIKSYETLDKL
ncbi:uncharacterized protein LOC124535603 [Vanessa cardui]|uniref:uncharacterized protein LOC124535603 n=1 Tax=Vanessa cardui TaxID=171605 RepID=UPI001F13BD47|nr:uncharacterized protein LOC124535603 [Vanessa cardui]